MFQNEELREEVHSALMEVLRVRKKVEEQVHRIVDAQDLEEAQQHFLTHQVREVAVFGVSLKQGIHRETFGGVHYSVHRCRDLQPSLKPSLRFFFGFFCFLKLKNSGFHLKTSLM